MKKEKAATSLLIMLLSVSMIWYICPRIPFGNAQIQTYPITLPLSTSFENIPGQAHGRTDCVDWKTSNFYGYYGSGNSLQPQCGVVPNEVTPPTVFNFTFLNYQLRAAGYFGGAYPCYCYFDLFDQSQDCDFQTPFQIKPQTFISVWYYHYQRTDCMIDGEIYNMRTGQVWTLRDFNYNGQYIVDQNNVRLHPADRSVDNIGTWNYSSFDLSNIWNSDPGNWWVTKIWIGFDNGVSNDVGQAKTYFDCLTISYGVSGTSGKQRVEWRSPFGNLLSSTDATVSGSAVPWYWTFDQANGIYHLFVKVMASGWVSNAVDDQATMYTVYWVPYNLMVNCSQSCASQNTRATPFLDAAEVNLTTAKQDPSVSRVDQYLADCLEVAAGILIPEFSVVEATILAAKGAALYFSSGQTSNTYTYTWAQANCEDSAGNPHELKSDFGEILLDIPVPSSSRNIQIPITLYTNIAHNEAQWPGWMEPWPTEATLSTSLTLTWTTPNIDPRPSGSSPIVGFANPAPAGSFGVCHVGNPSLNDCNMQAKIAGQGTAAWVPTGTTIPLSFSGYIWARPGAPGNTMYAVFGIGNTALSTAQGGGTSCPGVYPGLPFSTTINFNVGSYSPGTYNFYGVAAAQTSQSDAMNYYNNNPSARFLLGTMTLYPASTGIGQFHGPTLTVSACVNAPLPYLLKNQTSSTGNPGYVFTELTTTAGGVVIGWQNMTCTNTVTQAPEDGGNFTYTYNLAPLTVNQYYLLWFTATSTDGQPPQTNSIKIYYYDNPPLTPNPLSGSTPKYVYTYYTLSTSTTDHDGDNINYLFDWGDGNTWTSGWVASGTVVSPSHQWTVPYTYTVSVKAQDTPYGLWSNPTTLTVSISQNDAGQGTDAGNSRSSAMSISPNGGYYGTLYYDSKVVDQDDWYSFTCDTAGKEIDISVSSSTLTSTLELYNPSGTLLQPPSGPSNYPWVSWVTSVSGIYYMHVHLASGEGQYYFSTFVGYPSGGCPVLSYYDGQEYRCEGLLPIHNPNGTDITTTKTLRGTPKQVNGVYLFRLTEDVQTISHIDQVKLYAVLQDGKTVTLPLLYAWHSEYGNVLPQLLFADGWHTVEYGANYNNGVSQSIQLKFQALPSNVKIQYFIFQIKGCNMIVKN